MLCWKLKNVIIIDLLSMSANLCKFLSWYSGHINYSILVNFHAFEHSWQSAGILRVVVLIRGGATISSNSLMPLPDLCRPVLVGCWVFASRNVEMEVEFVITNLLFKDNICLTPGKLGWLMWTNCGLYLNITSPAEQGICLPPCHFSKDINNVI